MFLTIYGVEKSQCDRSTREKFGLEVSDVSTELQQCQGTVPRCLRSSPNVNIQQLADMADAKIKQ